jgi:hypothetical protein
LLTLTRVVRLFLFLLYEQVVQALIRFFGILPIRLEPSDVCPSLHRRALQRGTALSIPDFSFYFIINIDILSF